MNKCRHCGCEVVDGKNGTVNDERPPWDPTAAPLVSCYGCENQQEEQAELKRVADAIDAAQRAGRFDLI